MPNKPVLFTRLEQSLTREQMAVLNTLLHEDSRDSNTLILENHAFSRMEQEGFLTTFEDICEELQIVWSHTNEPLY